MNKFLIFIFVTLIIVNIGLFSYFFYFKYFTQKDSPIINDTQAVEQGMSDLASQMEKDCKVISSDEMFNMGRDYLLDKFIKADSNLSLDEENNRLITNSERWAGFIVNNGRIYYEISNAPDTGCFGLWYGSISPTYVGEGTVLYEKENGSINKIQALNFDVGSITTVGSISR